MFRPTPAEPLSSARPAARSTPGRPPEAAATAEDAALAGDGWGLQYGSFVAASPPQSPLSQDAAPNKFELPGPAMRPPVDEPELPRPSGTLPRGPGRFSTAPSSSDVDVPRPQALSSRRAESPSHFRRILSHASATGPQQQLDVVREREREFYDFVDAELDKVEAFYRFKEEQAGQRLAVLREQLHEMRNRRTHELAAADEHDHAECRDGARDGGHDKANNGWVHPLRARIFPPGPNSEALCSMPRTPHLNATASLAATTRRDYSRRPPHDDVSYRTAKRKLKLALQEFYRGLELLKSYALLNRTAFRKLNKKFDKAANARPPLRYMTEKVNRAWFVNSDVLDGHIRAVEDLYARYFERGNHKLAAGKLRGLASKASADESASSFVNGLLIGTGLVFTVQGLVYGSQLLVDDDLTLRSQTSYLMQLYAGYFLMLLLFSLFCVDCSIWTRNRVNYPFIFEFDPRSRMDWRRLAQFPSFFLLLLGIFMWLNFGRYGAPSLYLYYPVMLVSITAGVIFLPLPTLAHKSRKWLVYAHVGPCPPPAAAAAADAFADGAVPSGDSSWPVYIQSSFATFSWETCTVP